MTHGWEVESMFVERGVSGSVPLGERPEGAQMLATLKPGDVIITPKLDRMFRSALDALQMLSDFEKRQIKLYMGDLGEVTGNGTGKLVFTILSAVAEAERDRTRERVRDVKRDQKQRGRYLGGCAPFGYAANAAGELEPVPTQQEARARMVELRRAGRSLRAIAAEITATGLRISHVTVGEILNESEVPA